jgi:hypothetical protein
MGPAKLPRYSDSHTERRPKKTKMGAIETRSSDADVMLVSSGIGVRDETNSATAATTSEVIFAVTVLPSNEAGLSHRWWERALLSFHPS